MLKNPFLAYSMITEAVLCAALLVIYWRKGIVRQYRVPVALTAVWGTGVTVAVTLLFFRSEIGLSVTEAYPIYVYSYWANTAIEYILVLCVIYQIFRASMKPFRGLRRFGTTIFWWVGGVSTAVTFGIALAPMQEGSKYLTAIVQVGQSISILTICLLLFVCFAAHYLGMTYRSRVFGMSLGLGVQGLSGLVSYAWVATHGVSSLYASANAIPIFGTMLTVSIWGTYFLLPEPVAKMVLLPTTSPYFHWNQVSEALGNSPGMVAVAGFTPEMLSGAERSMLGATAKRRAQASARTLVDRMAGSVEVATQEHAVAMPR